MDAHSPITVAIARFPDLLALGLRAALADDPSVSVVAHDIELQPHRRRCCRRTAQDVLIVDADELIDLAMVRDLTS